VPTRRQSLILMATEAIRELSSAINTACQHEDYTDDLFAAYLEQIAEMHLKNLDKVKGF
jgi:hypothetical protein